jgi:hypothetical protein
MELAAIVRARAIGFIEPMELNQKGQVFYPKLVQSIVGRYGFQVFPQKIEDFNESKGITFASGILGNEVIDEFVIYTHGLLLGTRTSTHDSQRLLEEAIKWGVDTLGLTKRPITRWQFFSELTFYSKFSLMGSNTPAQRLAQDISRCIKEETGESLKYEQTSIFIDHDPLVKKHPMGRFSIQRRDNTPFSENKYFSDAPLHTETHWKLLEEFEADIARR